jgi:sortase (surface protein transpeptidase)
MRKSDRFSLVVLVLAGLGMAGLSGFGLAGDLRTAKPVAQTQSTSNAFSPYGQPASTVAPVPLASGEVGQPYPVSLSIPAIGVHTTLMTLGLTSTGALAVPTDTTQAGWFTGSPVPGNPGPSVLAGHVDSTTGPAVFYKLSDLKPGDTIAVVLSDQSTVRFVVTMVESYAKTAFPTTSVYGPVPDAELRVITCGGAFSAGHYLNNVVVYATLESA